MRVLNMDKRPKFFCEYCGTEVKRNDRVCPKCGKFFASVKCPSCGLTGNPRDFRDGCPSCGYAFKDSGDMYPASGQKKGSGARGGPTDPLPWWMYLASALLCALVFALILLNR